MAEGTESRRWWKGGAKAWDEWTREGKPKELSAPVGATDMADRYHWPAYDGTYERTHICVKPGGTAGVCL